MDITVYIFSFMVCYCIILVLLNLMDSPDEVKVTRTGLVDMSLMPSTCNTYASKLQWVKKNYPGGKCSSLVAGTLIASYEEGKLGITAIDEQ